VRAIKRAQRRGIVDLNRRVGSHSSQRLSSRWHKIERDKTRSPYRRVQPYVSWRHMFAWQLAQKIFISESSSERKAIDYNFGLFVSSGEATQRVRHNRLPQGRVRDPYSVQLMNDEHAEVSDHAECMRQRRHKGLVLTSCEDR